MNTLVAEFKEEAGAVSTTRYSRVAIALHWTIAALIAFNLGLGFFMLGFPLPLALLVGGIHVSSGMTVLALTVVRIVWRLTHAPPPHPAGLKPWERHTAAIVHFLLYLAMVLMPVTGWSMMSAHPPAPASAPAQTVTNPGSAAGPPTPTPKRRNSLMTIWWTFELPAIKPIEQIGATPGGIKPQEAVHDAFLRSHVTGAYLFVLLLTLHVAGALKHQFLDRRAQFARMGIGRRRPLTS
jgi:cytochrome b561